MYRKSLLDSGLAQQNKLSILDWDSMQYNLYGPSPVQYLELYWVQYILFGPSI